MEVQRKIGLFGGSASGKSTLFKALSPLESNNEFGLFRNNMQKNFSLVKNNDEKEYISLPVDSIRKEEQEKIGNFAIFDCSTKDPFNIGILSGAPPVDVALYLIDSTQYFPNQPLQFEHLQILEILQPKNIIILQTKIDLISETKVKENYDQIKACIKDSFIENCTIIPISSVLQINLDILWKNIIKLNLSIHESSQICTAPLFQIYQFQNNISLEPNTTEFIGYNLQGSFKIGDEIILLPGNLEENTPIKGTISKISIDNNLLNETQPGMIYNLGMQFLGQQRISNVIGQKITSIDCLNVFTISKRISISFYPINNLFFGKNSNIDCCEENLALLLQIGKLVTSAKIVKIEEVEMGTQFCLELNSIISCQIGERLLIKRKNLNNWELVGWGTILRG